MTKLTRENRQQANSLRSNGKKPLVEKGSSLAKKNNGAASKREVSKKRHVLLNGQRSVQGGDELLTIFKRIKNFSKKFIPVHTNPTLGPIFSLGPDSNKK